MRQALPLLMVPALLWGQPDPRRRMEGQNQGWLKGLRMNRLQQTLGLGEEKAKAIADRWTRFDGEHIEKARQMRQLRHRFNEILMGPGSEADKDQRLKPLLEQFVEVRKQQMDLRQRFEEDIRAELTPAQQVRFILLAEDLRETLREGIREVMREGRPLQR